MLRLLRVPAAAARSASTHTCFIFLLALFCLPIPAHGQTGWLNQEQCQTTPNPGYCSSCSVQAIARALACALTGQSCFTEMDQMFDGCMANVTPEPPPSPTPPPEPDICGGGPVLQMKQPGPAKSRARYAESASACVTFLDPVSELQNPQDPTKLKQTRQFGRGGREVTGIAADGVAQVVIRVRAQSLGQVFTITLADQEGGSGQQIGWLTTVNGSEPDTTTQLQVTADTVAGLEKFAFAVYHAPVDFSRGGAEDNARTRSVQFHTESLSGSYYQWCQLTIWRPPVVLVHGLWGSPDNWNTFLPFTQDQMPAPQHPASWGVGRFFQSWVNYADRKLVLTGSYPSFNSGVLIAVSPNALGLSYNAKAILFQIRRAVDRYRQERQLAAAQADILAHSMGGLMARTLTGLPEYLDGGSFGKGVVHKLITVGTPHRGTPLANMLLSSENTCVRSFLASKGKPSFLSATLEGGAVVDGAVGDLRGNLAGDNYSNAIATMRAITRRIPVAMIAGQLNQGNLNGLDQIGFGATSIRVKCGATDPLAQKLRSNQWMSVFNYQPNDAIVPVLSQFDGGTSEAVTGVVHSSGVTGRFGLGFNGPHELDNADSSPGIQAQVVQCLNEQIVGLVRGGAGSTAHFQILP
jgi:pimeloyl-ACP methyl ester carboxylesterase